MFTRLLVVLHLVLCLSLLFFQLFRSFSESYFTYHHTLNIYQNIFADESLLSHLKDAGLQTEYAKVLRHRQRFDALSATEKQQWIQAYQKHLNALPYTTFFKNSLQRFFFELPPLIMGYLCLSLASCILYLYRIQGAYLTLYLLPITLIAYLLMFQTPSQKPPPSFYPTEDALLNHYSPPKELSSEKRLVLSWQAYLIDMWSSKPFTGFDQSHFSHLAEEGEFFFQLHRLKHAAKTSTPLRPPNAWYFHKNFLLSLFIWNLFLTLWLLSRELRATN